MASAEDDSGVCRSDPPGIAQRGEGPDRRAWIVGTPYDVWQVVDAQERHPDRGELAAALHLSEQQVGLALAYYERHPEEVEAALQRVDRPREPSTTTLLRWLRRQLRQPTPEREHLEAAVERGDAAEVRRLLGRVPFSDAQRRYMDDLVAAWETEVSAGRRA